MRSCRLHWLHDPKTHFKVVHARFHGHGCLQPVETTSDGRSPTGSHEGLQWEALSEGLLPLEDEDRRMGRDTGELDTVFTPAADAVMPGCRSQHINLRCRRHMLSFFEALVERMCVALLWDCIRIPGDWCRVKITTMI